MPCMCWYDPSDQDKKELKALCQAVVDKVKALNKIGDAYGCEIRDVHELIDHLYNPRSCKENLNV